MNRAMNFAEINLAAAGVHVNEISSTGHCNVAANSFQLRAAADLPGTNVTAAGAQRSVSCNVACIDVAARSEGREIARDILNLNMTTFRFQLGKGVVG
jgi:hypothetical protein